MTDAKLDILLGSPLFRDITKEELTRLLPCLDATLKQYDAEECIVRQGMEVSYIYIILSGHIEIIKSNFAGQKNIVSVLTKGKLFGEGLVCTKNRLSPISAMSTEKTELFCIPYQNIIGGCSHSCGFHHQLIFNMMLLLGEKNYQLNTKMDLLLLKGLREKLATYLLREAEKRDTISFTVSLNRNQLAEYLNVSRPSMCRELGRMKEEGLIDYYQNSFKLLDLATLKQFT